MFDSILNQGYLSPHYLDALLQADLDGLRKRWDTAEARGEETPRRALRGLSRAFFAAKTRWVESAGRDLDAVRLAHDAVLGALGYPVERTDLCLVRGGEDVGTVKVASTLTSGTGPVTVALELAWAQDVDAALDSTEAGALLDPASLLGETKPVSSGADAAAAIFAADDSPRYVLLLAGGIVILADRAVWGEGRFLAVDLDVALERQDGGVRGELATIAALLCAAALVPTGGPAVLDQVRAASLKHAVGVSKDLRDGIRRSVELLANEVIAQRLAKKLVVYAVADLPAKLSAECLRFLYRLLVLLYAESHPELGILPTDCEHYQGGYGLERLRDLALTKLTTDTAADGSHLHESLDVLFRLVNEGYDSRNAQPVLPLGDHRDGDELGPSDHSNDTGLVFPALHSELFGRDSTPLINEVRLRNRCLQQVLQLLLLSKEQRGKDRGFVSYAQLGINQLGAVYEGLMSYTGFFAPQDQDLYEVAEPGSQDKGTWVVPVSRSSGLPDDVFVTRSNPETGATQRVRHERGSFVFLLSGRARQRSASYYTPEVLTSCVVRHSLAELLQPESPADRILDLTICEPALGSGAFLNEAVNQLAVEYLRRRQAELGRTIDPEHYLSELQRVKAHLALHQCYGVDLNRTAVELAEVSLWLNCMYPGLEAPWFGLHLRRGNSLVGCRRAVYRRDQVFDAEWLARPAEDRPLATGALQPGDVHHFLLPSSGWAAVVNAAEAKELDPDGIETLKTWRKIIRAPLGERDAHRLAGLAERVESLWALAATRLRLAEKGLRRPVQVWGAGDAREPTTTRRLVEAELEAPNSALSRLRLVMDIWCALWFWPLDGSAAPSRAQWIDALEGLVGLSGETPSGEQISLLPDLEALVERERQLTYEFHMRDVGNVKIEHPWLAEVARIADREAFWHWELELAHIFQAGGFDLQIGNPPWVRLDWKDDITLAEFDPWFGLTEKPPANTFASRRTGILADAPNRTHYLAEAASASGLTAILGSPVERPLLAGLRTNLYMVFMDTVWRHASPTGIAGLLHPESHFTDPKGSALRRETYHRLRRHWQFNETNRWFEGVDSPTAVFGVHVYGPAQRVGFLQVSNLQAIETLEGSLTHDGNGAVPGIQYPAGERDLRPHVARLLAIDERVLAAWAKLFDEPGTAFDEARILRPVTRDDLEALDVLAAHRTRLADHEYHWTSGFNETNSKEDGLIHWDTRFPASWDEVILQGPHFTVATPFAKQPNEGCKSKGDYSSWDLETLPERVVPRTNYQRACSRDRYEAALDHWDGRSSRSYWRLTWRAMTQPGPQRSLHSALIPPGLAHINSAFSLACDSQRLTALAAGLWSTLVIDYLVKVAGVANVTDFLVRRFPFPHDHTEYGHLLLRTLRLNCLTADYAPLWEELYDKAWPDDVWTDPHSARPPLGKVGRRWDMATPLRTDYDRRMALVELDALAALILGLSAEQLCSMYRTQFAVLRKYEYAMAFDASGRKIAKDHHAQGFHQQPGDWELVERWESDHSVDLPDRYRAPFTRPDREGEMTRAYREFARRLHTRGAG